MRELMKCNIIRLVYLASKIILTDYGLKKYIKTYRYYIMVLKITLIHGGTLTYAYPKIFK